MALITQFADNPARAAAMRKCCWRKNKRSAHLNTAVTIPATATLSNDLWWRSRRKNARGFALADTHYRTYREMREQVVWRWRTRCGERGVQHGDIAWRCGVAAVIS